MTAGRVGAINEEPEDTEGGESTCWKFLELCIARAAIAYHGGVRTRSTAKR